MTEANMRRLPSWMLKAKTAENPHKSATEVEKSTKSDIETKIQAVESKCKPLEKKNNDKIQTQERKIKPKEDIMDGCKTRRRNTQTERYDEDAKKKSKRLKFEDEVKINRSANGRKQQMKKRSKNCDVEVISADMSGDEEVSLTVEDLVRIAKVYVSVDRERQCKDQAITDKLSEPSSSVVSSMFGVEGAILSKCTNNSLNSHLVQSNENESNNDKSDNISSSTISTGDAVQDMLNLYLGPFINNPAPVEPRVKAVESENFSTFQATERERMPSLSDFNKQVGSEIPKEEADARLMKKKSSLRDKVAMFID